MRRKQSRKIIPEPVPTSLDEYLDLAVCSDYFRRKDQRDAFLKDFHAGVNPIFVCGGHNSGKTVFTKELAYALTQRWKYGMKWTSRRDPTYTMHYQTNIFKTICNYHIPGYVLDLEDRKTTPLGVEEQVFRDKYKLLRKYTPEKSIFILEDVNGVSIADLTSDPHYNDLLGLGRVFIVTDDTETYPEYVIDPLPKSYLPDTKCDLSRCTEKERLIAQRSSLIPSTGMNEVLFARANGVSLCDLLSDGELQYILLHQSREFFPLDIPFSGEDNDYLPFLDKLYEIGKQPLDNSIKYDQICHCYKNAAHFLNDEKGIVAQRAGELFKARGDFHSALPLFELFLEKQEALTPRDPITLAEAYYAVGCFRAFYQAAFVRDFDSFYLSLAEDMFNNALTLQTDNLPAGHVSIGMTQMAIAHVKSIRYDYIGADSLREKTIKALLANTTNDYKAIAEIYIMAAGLYHGRDGRPLKRDYTEKALELLKDNNDYSECFTDACIEMSESFSLRDVDQRISWIKKAIDNHRKVAPQKANILRFLLERYIDALEPAKNFEEQATALSELISLLEERLPPNHKTLAFHYNKLERVNERRKEATE